MTSFCHGPLSIGGRVIIREKGVELEEIRQEVRKYHQQKDQDEDLVIRIAELSAQYITNETDVTKIIAMLNEESTR